MIQNELLAGPLSTEREHKAEASQAESRNVGYLVIHTVTACPVQSGRSNNKNKSRSQGEKLSSVKSTSDSVESTELRQNQETPPRKR